MHAANGVLYICIVIEKRQLDIFAELILKFFLGKTSGFIGRVKRGVRRKCARGGVQAAQAECTGLG